MFYFMHQRNYARFKDINPCKIKEKENYKS